MTVFKIPPGLKIPKEPSEIDNEQEEESKDSPTEIKSQVVDDSSEDEDDDIRGQEILHQIMRMLMQQQSPATI